MNENIDQEDDVSVNYNARKYRTPDGAPTDIVIFTITSTDRAKAKKTLPHRELQVLLIKRKRWPFEGRWALPGGFTNETETVHECAKRELCEETGVKNVHIEYFNAYSAPNRDPRGWMISHAFFALVNEVELSSREAASDAAEVGLFSMDEAAAMELAFDHNLILQDALARIREMMVTTTIAKSFLPVEFTISELYQVLQTVVPDFEERNFIRKITSTQSRRGIIEEVRNRAGEPMLSNRHSQRAAQLYRFTDYVPRLSIYS
ncbi:NUDIX domain-containing protein [Paenibacillus mendelii]|uniref:NUDIX domain-containing protein n=1 Tax=Paenibacillus mendelii TaxID=206163 RepID=A0ABV6JD56_9BACL|nr:NUDIX hydrolase [Paenibacillus mendelii]MCQ6562727.1 NUDIX hydrolase [Paenibacillus mendelii]